MKCRVNTIDPHAFWPIKHGLVLFINYVIRHKSESIIEYNANQVPNMVVGNFFFFFLRNGCWELDALNPPLLYIFVNFLSQIES